MMYVMYGMYVVHGMYGMYVMYGMYAVYGMTTRRVSTVSSQPVYRTVLLVSVTHDQHINLIYTTYHTH